MNAQRERCILELGDAAPEVILYACLVALMAGGPGEHQRVESAVAEQLATGRLRRRGPLQRRSPRRGAASSRGHDASPS